MRGVGALGIGGVEVDDPVPRGTPRGLWQAGDGTRVDACST